MVWSAVILCWYTLLLRLFRQLFTLTLCGLQSVRHRLELFFQLLVLLCEFHHIAGALFDFSASVGRLGFVTVPVPDCYHSLFVASSVNCTDEGREV